jgi:penicillin-binding protein 1B
MKKTTIAVSLTGGFLCILLILAFFTVRQVMQLNSEIEQTFEGKRWSLPAVLYARPLELYPGLELTQEMLEKELQLAGYRREVRVQDAGGYNRSGTTFQLVTRDFVYPSGLEKSVAISVVITNDHVARLTETGSGSPLAFSRIDPARIGSFHPLVHEDRIVLQSSEIPLLLRETLIAVEDKAFFSHHGISIVGIARAFLANIAAGKTVQGGSTLTQQLVKNLFLNRQRTLSRKIQEAVMAVLLDFNYSKEEILTAYCNEVYLGQDGARAIHGFAMASQFHFRRDLKDLSVSQIATLVGMVKGPIYYDPLKKPDNAFSRRAVVLGIMRTENIIDQQTALAAEKQPLTDVVPQKNSFNRFPAFLELVRRQLQTEYREEDLKSNGLKILTTLDPQVQWQVEHQLLNSVNEIEDRTGVKNIEGAVVVTGRENGEILAIAGGRNALQPGFNRALDASRHIGSLVKPAVYLTALAKGYTLASPLLDTEIHLDNNGESWRPENYDQISHGRVGLYTALAKSYNQATVRLGLEVGLSEVISTLAMLGYSKPIEPYPSLLLGAIDMSPLEVTQFYQTIASGGFYLPLRSIRAVMDNDDSLLTRYGLEVEQHFSPELMFLLTHGLQRVMEEGTGSRYRPTASRSYAGKTGTSDNLRDSWFAGFSGDRLSVVWLGRDDNKPTKLTGASGALIVWGRIMQGLRTAPLEQSEPAGIDWGRIDAGTLQWTHPLNPDSTLLPFISVNDTDSGRQPESDIGIEDIKNKTKTLFDSLYDLFK